MENRDEQILQSWFDQAGYSILYMPQLGIWAAGHKDTENGNREVTPGFETFDEFKQYMWDKMESSK